MYICPLNFQSKLWVFKIIKTKVEERTAIIKIHQDRLYIILAGIFVASLVSSNLIFQKFFFWTPFSCLQAYNLPAWTSGLSQFTFELSVGILPYPITFLVTDIVSEIYGRKKADQIVIAGFIASIFMMIVIAVGDLASATEWSPVGNETFHQVFGLFGPAVFASMTAYLLAQFIDIRVFHFWKRLTKGRHLWLRNNGSTIFSQFIDTFSVLVLLCNFNVIDWQRFAPLLFSGFLFKLLVAMVDTPFFYFFSYILRKKFNLKLGEELQ